MKIYYRPEIDGLRAIAVGAVIFYHAKINLYGQNLFAGGFIGVDIFFVISGYLITSIILKELVLTNEFSLINFYKRRVRRILPVLLLVTITTIPLAWKYILPNSLVDYSKSILSSLGFISNLYFHFSGQQYGAGESLLKPFLHTWSLSIEEQFYIFFPIIFILIFRQFKNSLMQIFIFLFFLSLGFAIYGNMNFPALNFYLIFSRSWELLAGSILALLESKKKEIYYSLFLKKVMPSIGLLLIMHSIFFTKNEINHPSIYTIEPIIGTCVLIWFCNKEEFITKVLSSKLFVKIGLISYSLYLWHYPIFAFSRISHLTNDNLAKELLVGVFLIICSIFSYHLIERPARNKKLKFSKVFSIIIIMYILIAFFNFLSIKNDGFKGRSHFPKILINTINDLDYRKIKQENKLCHNRIGSEGFCIFNQLNKNSADIILLGDSLTDSLLGSFIEQVKKTDYRLIHMSYSGNLFLPNFVLYDKNLKKITADETIHKYREDFIKNKTNKNSYIIILGDYNHYFEKRIKFNDDKEIITYTDNNIYAERENLNLDYEKRIENFKTKFKKTLLDLSQNHKIILLNPLPISPESVLDRIKNLSFKKEFNNKNFYVKDKINYSKKFYKDYNSEILNLFDNINNKNIFRLSAENIFCPEDQCFLYNNDQILIFDIAHPSKYASTLINQLILNKIKNIEKN